MYPLEKNGRRKARAIVRVHNRHDVEILPPWTSDLGPYNKIKIDVAKFLLIRDFIILLVRLIGYDISIFFLNIRLHPYKIKTPYMHLIFHNEHN